MGKHTAPESKTSSLTRRVARHAMHPVVHIVAIVTLHVIALGILEKTALLMVLFGH